MCKERERWADVIIAWANGEQIQFTNVDRPNDWSDWHCHDPYSPAWNKKGRLYRVKPVYLTLGEIARRAWLRKHDENRFAGDALWDASAAAVKAAISSGEFS